MRLVHALLPAALLLGACQSNRPLGPIENPGDADSSLQSVLVELQDLRDGGEEAGGSEGGAARLAEVKRRMRALELRHPRHAPTLTAAATLALEEGARDRAVVLLDQATESEPGFVPAALLRASLAASEGNLGLGRRRLEEALLEHPDDPRLHEALAGILHLSGDSDAARRELSLARELWGDAAPAGQHQYHLGLVAESEGRLDEAVLHYRAGLELAPEDGQMAARLRALEAL